MYINNLSICSHYIIIIIFDISFRKICCFLSNKKINRINSKNLHIIQKYLSEKICIQYIPCDFNISSY